MNKLVKTNELFDCQVPYLKQLFECEYPWQMLPMIKDHINTILASPPDGYTFFKEGILVGENVSIHPNAVIIPPAVIGSGTEIRPGAYLRGHVITGRNCVVGNSSELKNCILLDKVQVPHYNYVGDSILGNYAHMGAGSICSNLKSDGSNVVIRAEMPIETGLRKIGGILADHADIGCNCVLNPGTVVGKNTSVYPMNALRGVFAANCIIKSMENIVKKR